MLYVPLDYVMTLELTLPSCCSPYPVSGSLTSPEWIPRTWLKKLWRRKNNIPIDSVIDTTRTTLEVLKESADACPPLKSTVGGVLAFWDIHMVCNCYLLAF